MIRNVSKRCNQLFFSRTYDFFPLYDRTNVQRKFRHFTYFSINTALHLYYSYFKLIALFATSKIEISNSPILEFKALQNAFKIKKQGWKYFSKVIDKNYYTYTIKRGFLKALWLLCSILNSRIGEFDFWRLVHVIWHRMTNLV